MSRDEALDKEARLDNMGRVMGRDPWWEQPLHAEGPLVTALIRALGARRLQPVLLGPAGSGRRSTIETLARAAHRERFCSSEGDKIFVPRELEGRRFVETTPADFISGALYALQLEHKTKLVVQNLQREDAILVLDNLAAFVGPGASAVDPENDIANLLYPFIRRGVIRVIATATPEGFNVVQRLRPALARLFLPVHVPSASEPTTVSVLRSHAAAWKHQHAIRFDDDALHEVVAVVRKLYPWKALPGAAVQLFEAVAGAAHQQAIEPNDLSIGDLSSGDLSTGDRSSGDLSTGDRSIGEARRRRPEVKEREIDADSIGEVVISLEAILALQAREAAAAATAAEVATSRLRVIAAPDFAVSATGVRQTVRALTGLPEFLLEPAMPLSGQTVAAELSGKVYGQEPIVRAMAERILMLKAGLCAPRRPLGAFLLVGPTGVGKTLLARSLASFLRGSESHLIRYDMSEYAAPDSIDRFLGGNSRLAGSDGLVDVVLSEPMPIILLDEIEKAHRVIFDTLLQVFGEGRLTDLRGRTASFDNAMILMTSNLGSQFRAIHHPPAAFDPAASRAYTLQSVRDHFRPEFLNRLTGVLVFERLQLPAVEQIARREISRVAQHAALERRQLVVDVTPEALQQVIATGWSERYGARPMERAVERLVGSPIAAYMAENPDARAQLLSLVVDQGEVVIRVEDAPVCAAELPAAVLDEQRPVAMTVEERPNQGPSCQPGSELHGEQEAQTLAARLELHADDSETFNRLATNYQRRQRWDELTALLFDQANRRQGSNGEAVALLHLAARLHEEQRDKPADAMAALRKALELAPSCAATMDELERLAGVLGAWPPLLRFYERIAKRVGWRDQRHTLLFRAALGYHHQAHDFDRAERSYLAVLATRKNHRPALQGLATLYRHQEREEDLAEVLRRLAAAEAAEEDADAERPGICGGRTGQTSGDEHLVEEQALAASIIATEEVPADRARDGATEELERVEQLYAAALATNSESTDLSGFRARAAAFRAFVTASSSIRCGNEGQAG